MLRLPRLFRLPRTKGVGASLIAVAVGLTLLAGCAEDEPKPKFADDPSASPSSPSAATAPKNETVKEFLTRWAEAESEMQNTGKTDEYLALSSGCAPCEALAKRVEAIYGNEGFIRSEAMNIERVKRVKNTDVYDVWLTVAPSAFRESATEKEESYEGGPRLYRISVDRSPAGLSVTSLAKMPR